jgi:23S rRNA (pseudouridine1915-N3)-methyltransferase
MLSVQLICVGKMKETYLQEAFDEYRKRQTAYCRLEVTEIAEERLSERPSQAEIDAALRREAEQIRKAVGKDAKLITLCVEGKSISSEELAELLQKAENSGKPKLCFVIGGSFGLAQELKEQSVQRISMSRMTFPHHLARVMLAEQIYRGFKIREGSRYHK